MNSSVYAILICNVKAMYSSTIILLIYTDNIDLGGLECHRKMDSESEGVLEPFNPDSHAMLLVQP